MFIDHHAESVGCTSQELYLCLRSNPVSQVPLVIPIRTAQSGDLETLSSLPGMSSQDVAMLLKGKGTRVRSTIPGQ